MIAIIFQIIVMTRIIKVVIVIVIAIAIVIVIVIVIITVIQIKKWGTIFIINYQLSFIIILFTLGTI
jgi:hypothetical protein